MIISSHIGNGQISNEISKVASKSLTFHDSIGNRTCSFSEIAISRLVLYNRTACTLKYNGSSILQVEIPPQMIKHRTSRVQLGFVSQKVKVHL